MDWVRRHLHRLRIHRGGAGPWCARAGHPVTVLLFSGSRADLSGLEEVRDALVRQGVGAMADNPLVAEDIWKRCVCLPSGAALGMRFL